MLCVWAIHSAGVELASTGLSKCLTKADLSVSGVWECSTQQHDGEVLRPAAVYHSGLAPNGDGDQAKSLE